MNDYQLPPKGQSSADADNKNAKVFSWIAVAAFVVLHILAFTLSSTPLVNMHKLPALWALPVLAVIALILTVRAVLKDSGDIDVNPWPYRILLILSFASAVAIGYCPSC